MAKTIFDISKKTRQDAMSVLKRAKELGIASAKCVNSSLDEITAEWLSDELLKPDSTVADRKSQILEHFRGETPTHLLPVIEHVWANRERFVCWPKNAHLLIPGRKRPGNRYHSYSENLIFQLRAKAIRIDTRSNGPAIMAFFFAGGTRPKRLNGKGWSVHHIYDGQFPAPRTTSSLHAIDSGDHFTESSGLVAIHPFADGLASESPYFAWLLRCEAYDRFGYDPDHVIA